MIKNISAKIIRDDDRENESIIIQGVKRNFGGCNFDIVVSALESILQFSNTSELRTLKPELMIRENLVDLESRHQMIITDNQENTL